MLQNMTPQGFPLWLVAEGATVAQLVVGWDFSPQYFGSARPVVVAVGPRPKGPATIHQPYALYPTREEATMAVTENAASFLGAAVR